MTKQPAVPGPSDREVLIRTALLRYEQPLVRFARRLVGNGETARDIAQDCFLKLCQRHEPPEGPRLAAWLFTVCRNRAIDHLRKNGRMKHVNGTAILDLVSESSGDPSPLAAAASGDEVVRLRALVAELAPRQQEMLRLKFQDGLSYREIGEITGTSVSNVGFILHSALRALRGMATRTPSTATERSSR